jgi:hypothetical protein
LVKAEDSQAPVRLFFKHKSFGGKHGTKIVEKLYLTWYCSMCCIPVNGRVDFEKWLAYKIKLNSIE